MNKFNENELGELRVQVLNWYNKCDHKSAKVVRLLWDMKKGNQLKFNETQQQIAINVPAEDTKTCTDFINGLLSSIRKTVVLDVSKKHNGVKYVLETLLTIQKIEDAGNIELTIGEKIKRDITLHEMTFDVFTLQEKIIKPVEL